MTLPCLNTPFSHVPYRQHPPESVRKAMLTMSLGSLASWAVSLPLVEYTTAFMGRLARPGSYRPEKL